MVALKTTLCRVAILRTSFVGYGVQGQLVVVEDGQAPPEVTVEIPNKPTFSDEVSFNEAGVKVREITGYTDEPDIGDNMKLIKIVEHVSAAPAAERPEGAPEGSFQHPDGSWLVPGPDGGFVRYQQGPLAEANRHSDAIPPTPPHSKPSDLGQQNDPNSSSAIGSRVNSENQTGNGGSTEKPQGSSGVDYNTMDKAEITRRLGERGITVTDADLAEAKADLEAAGKPAPPKAQLVHIAETRLSAKSNEGGEDQ